MSQDSFINVRIPLEDRKRLESLISSEISLSKLVRQVLRLHIETAQPMENGKK